MHGMMHVHQFVQVQWLFQMKYLKIEKENLKALARALLKFEFVEHCRLKHSHGDSWITVSYVDRMTLTGGGVFYGQGKAGWKKNDCHKRIDCANHPVVSSIPYVFLFINPIRLCSF